MPLYFHENVRPGDARVISGPRRVLEDEASTQPFDLFKEPINQPNQELPHLQTSCDITS